MAKQHDKQGVVGLPGDGVPKTPTPTPWVPNAPPTGNPGPIPGPSSGQKPPGWWPTFDAKVDAMISNPAFDPRTATPEIMDSIMHLAEILTDHMMRFYPH